MSEEDDQPLTLEEILTLDDRGVSRVTDHLAVMFRTILLDLNITPVKWNRAVSRYGREKGVKSKSLSSDRSNFNRAFCNDRITWRTLRKGLDILGPKKISYQLTLTWRDDLEYPVEPPKVIEYESFGRANELIKMYHQIWVKMQMNPILWDHLLDRAVREVVGDNPTQKSTLRGNLNKPLLKSNEYNWLTFYRGMRILGVRHMEFCIFLHWSRRTTQHCFPIEIKPIDIES